jgi:hypothetical protein
MRAPQMRRGFGNAASMSFRATPVTSCQPVIVSRQRIIMRTIFKIAGGPNSMDAIVEMRLPTLLAHFRQFILTANYKGFCNVVIHELQFGSRDRDLRQLGVVIKNPGPSCSNT